MKPLANCLLFCLVTALSAFSQAVSDPNGDVGVAPSGPIDYEAARQLKVATAVRVREGIVLDGRLDESDWNLAVQVGEFVQQQPRTGELSPEPTEVRFLYDDDNLYIGVFLYDSGTPIVTSMSYDFQPRESDNINIVIDSLHDRRSGFSFTANPAGGKRDQQIANDGQANLEWKGVWDVRTNVNSEGWTAEFQIPFKTLRFSSSASQEWGLNMGRRTLRLNENAQWTPVPIRYSQFRVSMAGTLTGLENIRQGRNLKITPFATAGVIQSRQPDGQVETIQSLSRLKDYDGGVDLKYSITPSLTLDATYRTDFAQVEVDQQQVNLTRFSLFFPEKRDFFLENTGNFSFGAGVGFRPRNANLVPFFSRRIGLAQGTPIPIVGGSRVSGRVDQYDIGLLAMKTEEAGTIPSNTYLVGRIKRNLFRNSWVGGIVTNRDSSIAGDYNRVYGTDVHFQFYENLEFDSYLLRSDTPDRSGKNQAGKFQAAWIGNELRVGGEYSTVQTNFNPEVGFIRRRNMSLYSGEFTLTPRLTGSETIQSLTFGSRLDYYQGGTTEKVETRTQEVTVGMTFENSAFVTFITTQTFDRLVDPFPIRSELSILAGDYKYLTYTADAGTNPSRKISGNAEVTWGEFWNGRQRSLGGGLSLKPDYHLNMSLNYRRDHVRLAEGAFTTDLLGARVAYGFTPRTFLNAFFQYNTDTNQFSSNIRFNIIHRPLSDLYLVYNDTRDTDRGQLFGRAFFIKFTNLFSF